MKKLIDGIFARSHSSDIVHAASSLTKSDDFIPNVSATKRWGGLVLPSLTHPGPFPADQEKMKNVCAVLRGVAMHVKTVISAIMEAEEYERDLKNLRDFVQETFVNQQQCDDLSVEGLKTFFSDPLGLNFCEQTAFPSLVLDFAAKMRIFAVKEELCSTIKLNQSRKHEEQLHQSGKRGIFVETIASLEFLMKCVVAIASNETLMEKFRCEMPTLIALIAEEYPSVAIFLRDYCSRALLAVSERNFNAGLTWYLLDCDIIAQTVKRMEQYTLASTSNFNTVGRTLQNYTPSPLGRFQAGGANVIDDSAAAAAVSEALGLRRSSSNASDRETYVPVAPLELPSDDVTYSNRERDISIPSETICLPSYDAQGGFSALVYVLEKTYRFTHALLEEFHTVGGYQLLLRLLDTCDEEKASALLNALACLVPLDSRLLENNRGETCMPSVGARNVYAFSTMRDLVLKYISDLPYDAETASNLDISIHRRNEQLILQSLTQILQLYTVDYANFVFLEPRTQTLALLLTKLPCTKFYEAQVIILRIVEYVCCAAHPNDLLPHKILSVLCGLLIAYDPLGCHESKVNVKASDEVQLPSELAIEDIMKAFEVGAIPTLSTSVCELLIKILRDSETDSYKQEVSAFGLMDRGIYVWLDQIATCLTTISETDSLRTNIALTVLKPHLDMYAKLSCLMLHHNFQEIIRFRQAQAHRSLYVIVEVIISSDAIVTPCNIVKESHLLLNELPIALIFMELVIALRDTSSHETSDQLILLQNGVESDIDAVLTLMKRFSGFAWRQLVLLYILMDLLKAGGVAIARLWKLCRGYERLMAILPSESLLLNNDSWEIMFQLLDSLLELVNVSLDLRHGENDNAEYMRSINGYSTITSYILTSGFMQSSKKYIILRRVFDLIASGTSHIEILNGDAVFILFQLLPSLSECVAVNTMRKLLSMLECTSNACLILQKERAIRLIRAGTFEWMNNPNIVNKIKNAQDPLNVYLLEWITTIVLRENLSIPQFHHVLRLIGNTMPKLLNNQHCFTQRDGKSDDLNPETGLLLLQELVRYPSIRHISVGKPQEAGQTGQYVHIVNSTDRVWPPPTAYSFSCWLRFSTSDAYNTTNSSRSALEVKPIHPLCEGDLSLAPEGDHEECIDAYGVLIDTTLTLYASNEWATDNVASIGEYHVTNVARTGPLEWSFASGSQTFRVRCTDSSTMERWWYAAEQCLTTTTLRKQNDVDVNNALLSSFGLANNADPASQKTEGANFSEQEEGSACIVSIYSLETSGSYMRAYFEHSTGFLRFHTGAVNSGPSINSNTKITSVVFDEITIDDLKPAGTPYSTNKSTTCDGVSKIKAGMTNRMRDWHHFAFTHRKSAMGSSLITVYIDGRDVATKKLHYPSAPSIGSFQAFIGTDAQVCSPHSALSWKIGPAWFTDEAISSSTVGGMFSLGPAFSSPFSGHSYCAVGDWLEARASSHLARAADRGIEIAQLAQQLQLIKLGRSCRHWRDWSDFAAMAASVTSSTANDAVSAGAAFLAESMIAKKVELAEGLRLAAGGSIDTFRKDRNKVPVYRNFLTDECAMSSFGAEFESLLQTCKLSDDATLFTVNTSSSDWSSSPILSHTQVHYVNCDLFNGFNLARSLPSLGGLEQVIFPLLDHATRHCDFYIVFKMLVKILRQNPSCLAECIESNGYAFIAGLLCTRANLVDEKMLRCALRLAVAGRLVPYATTSSGETTKCLKLAHPVVVDSVALSQVLLNGVFHKKLPHHLQCQLVSLLMDLLVTANPNALFNARQLRRAGLFQWLLMYLTELGNEPCEMDQDAGLEMKWCFPKYAEPTFEAILQFVLSLLRAFLRIESCVDDFNGVGEMLLVSMTNSDLHAKESPIRIILLQFILHEIENDTAYTEDSDYLDAKQHSSSKRPSDTLVEAILYRDVKAPTIKKRDGYRFDDASSLDVPSLRSPRADCASKLGLCYYSVNGMADVFLDVIGQGHGTGLWASTEATLTLRILFSLAQTHLSFAEHLLCQTHLMQKLKRVLRKYSTNCCMYIPLLAYVLRIPIGDTSYSDLGMLSAITPGPKPSNSDVNVLADNVWELIGEQLLLNCQFNSSTAASEVTVSVLGIFAGHVKASSSFFAAVCKSSGYLFQNLAHCIFVCLGSTHTANDFTSDICQSEAKNPNPSKSVVDGSSTTKSSNCVYNPLEKLAERMGVETSNSMSIIDACVNLIQVIMTQALYGDEFGSLIMLFLKSLVETGLKQDRVAFSRVAGQKCWLALLKFVLERGKVLSTNISLIFMRNLITTCIALAQYLTSEQNHHVEESYQATDSLRLGATPFTVSQTDSKCTDGNAPACFGFDVVVLFLSWCEPCSLPANAKIIGVEQLQFFYGVLVYCAQTVMLIELNHAHGTTLSYPSYLLTCLIDSKHILLQQPKWQGVVCCGIKTQSTTIDANGGLESCHAPSGRPLHFMHRVRSLSANAHKEFSIGADSDRCFVFALSSVLFRMLMDESATICHFAIMMWQFLIDQRFDVLKELLILEPRTSVLQTITSSKKDATIDLFHGGFDRLLYALHIQENSHLTDNTESFGPSINQEIWSQFQHWIAESSTLLDDAIISKSEASYRYMLDVLSACIGIRQVSAGTGETELSLDLNISFRTEDETRGDVSDSFEPGRREIVAKKLALKYAGIKNSALKSMNDGLLLRRDLSLRLASTRNIWQTGRWQVGAAATDFAAEVELQRSIFQRQSFGYYLDQTEGPKRMRLKLLRDYSYEDRISTTREEGYMGNVEKDKPRYTEKLPQSSHLSSQNAAENRLICCSMEFHDAVEVYRAAAAAKNSEGSVRSLQSILVHCRMDATRQLYDDLRGIDLTNAVSILQIARRLYGYFFENSDGKSRLAVSPLIVRDINYAIEQSVESIPLTLFGAADAEATQSALYAVRQENSQAVHTDLADCDGSDIELGFEGTESDDSDDLDMIKQEIPSENSPECQPLQLLDVSIDTPVDDLTLDPMSKKVDQIKQSDNSFEAIYGAISCFLRKEDYPPLRSFNAAYVQGMGRISGLFLLCRHAIYFISGYTKLHNSLASNQCNSLSTESVLHTSSDNLSESKKKMTKRLIKAALVDLSMQFAPSMKRGDQAFTIVPVLDLSVNPDDPLAGQVATAKSSFWSIKYSNIKQFCRMKYQLRPVGIEFFDTCGSTYFLQLETSIDREEVVKTLFQMPLINSIFWSPILRTGALVPSIKRIRQAVTKRWLRGLITNFEYLIHLNTLAGRSFNDITQYPVFPWVIADYTSEFLDLDAYCTYRDLSKPMGALSPARAAQFCERFAGMSQEMDTNGPLETPAFHYGTHYSCSAYVINYLIRLEPFTAMALELQGGNFDHPDRLFRSIPSSWTSASRDNLQDVRELIPEFFYLPEFLYNANNCNFGKTQCGEDVWHVKLPPWAHDDPREFVRLNRRALESNYVSEHLHSWIDLVFGAKQKGQVAADAQNVFMHFTYEGTVDIEQITDPVMRAATLAQIENFGQTPSQLFSSPHPQRKVPMLVCTTSSGGTIEATSQLNSSVGHQHDSMSLSTIEAYVKWHIPLAPALVAIGKEYVFMKKHSALSASVNGVAIGDVKLVHDKMQCLGVGCCFMPPRCAKYLEWGSRSGVIRLCVYQQSSGTGRYREASKTLAVIEGAHNDGINCASLSEDGALLVTGGQDAVVNLIECSKASDGRRVFKQVAKFVGHNDAVVCVAINTELNLIASSSADRSVLLWDLRTRALLQELAGHTATVCHASINSANGNVLTTTNSELRLWSINGDLLAASSSATFGLHDISCAISTRCDSWQNGVIAVTGHVNGAIALWGIRYLVDLSRQKKEKIKAEITDEYAESSQVSGPMSSSPSSINRMDSITSPVSISNQDDRSNAHTHVVPSCQLFILKLLLDHRSKITALTLGSEQRQLFSGDAEGYCIRWVDDSVSPNIH
ncbi:putative BEACH domain, WD40-repeat-containing domain, PH-BEACH domain, BEACH domain superfamily [Plasmopara halstedii]